MKRIQLPTADLLFYYIERDWVMTGGRSKKQTGEVIFSGELLKPDEVLSICYLI